MMQQDVEQVVGICRIVLCATGGERFAVLGEGLGIDGVEDQEVVLQQRIDERIARYF